MTDKDALAHFEKCITFFRGERALLIEGRIDGEDSPLWANNRGAESAVYRLAELIRDYERIVKLVSTDIRSKR
jgi:hypothetical protein